MREKIEYLKFINKRLEHWNNLKAKTNNEIAEYLKHDFALGSKTYEKDDHKITITTGFNYKLDTKKYDALKDKIPFDIVSVKTKYDLKDSEIRSIEKYGSQEDKYLLSQLITSTPKKLHIKFEEVTA